MTSPEDHVSHGDVRADVVAVIDVLCVPELSDQLRGRGIDPLFDDVLPRLRAYALAPASGSPQSIAALRPAITRLGPVPGDAPEAHAYQAVLDVHEACAYVALALAPGTTIQVRTMDLVDARWRARHALERVTWCVCALGAPGPTAAGVVRGTHAAAYAKARRSTRRRRRA